MLEIHGENSSKSGENLGKKLKIEMKFMAKGHLNKVPRIVLCGPPVLSFLLVFGIFDFFFFV